MHACPNLLLKERSASSLGCGTKALTGIFDVICSHDCVIPRSADMFVLVGIRSQVTREALCERINDKGTITFAFLSTIVGDKAGSERDSGVRVIECRFFLYWHLIFIY